MYSVLRAVAIVAVTVALLNVVSALLPSDAVDLTTALFDKYTESNKHMFVEFYAPWCGHCQAFAPDFERIASRLKTKTIVAKVDCMKETSICGRWPAMIEGYPAMAFFEGEQPQKYYGDRSIDDVVKWVEGKIEEVASAGSSSVRVLHDGNFNQTLKANANALVEFYAPWCGHCKALQPIYEQLASRIGSKYLVGKVDCDLSPVLCARHNVEGYPTIFFFKNGKPTVFTGDRSVEALEQFAEDTATGGGFSDSSDVISLTVASFDQALESHQQILVEFYAPWCGHCKALAPEYEKAAGELKRTGSAVVLAKVDCIAEQQLCARFQVQGYPTLKWFHKQVATDYSGNRKALDILSWIERKTQGPVKLLQSRQQIDDWIEDHDEGVLGLFAGADKFHEILQHVADAREELQFAAVTDRPLAEQYAKTLPSVRYLRPEAVGDDVVFESQDYALLSDWLTKHALPLVGEIGPETFKKYTSLALPLLVAFVEPEKYTEAREVLLPTAKELQGVFSFGYSDGVRWKDVAKRWYGEYTALPVLVSVDFKKDIQLPYKGEFTAEAVRQFAEAIRDGRIKWTPRSEPVPKEQIGPVYVAVGETIESVISQPKDVLIEFYAPWCGHCQHLAPIYEELATELKPVESIVIAKLDHTANDVKHTVVGNQVQGFPTVLFFPANKKTTPIQYQGERTLEGFVKFLQQSAAVPFELPPALKKKLANDTSEEEEDEHDHDEL